MIYWQIFWANFTANILGYGGGPAAIPLLEHEVVNEYGWFTTSEFSEMVALGNGLPGPISTKLAAYIGYEQGGILGSLVGLFGTVAPTLILMIMLIGFLMKYKNSPKIKRLTQIVRPAIAVLLGAMTLSFIHDSYLDIGWVHVAVLVTAGYIFLEKVKISPVYVILGALTYGALFLGG